MPASGIVVLPRQALAAKIARLPHASASTIPSAAWFSGMSGASITQRIPAVDVRRCPRGSAETVSVMVTRRASIA